MEKEHTQLDELKELDAQVKKPATIFGYVYGSISAIIMGSGMSLVMTGLSTTLELENALVPGIVIGVIGMVMAITTYPIYKKMLASRREKYAEQIMKLSDKIMGGK